ncbi:hypothetical protein KJ780_05255 [Candidatus Micrarchaeota archaeon]|nr:hypothetical protein [Candidatus Micrarchaeota archaeon]
MPATQKEVEEVIQWCEDRKKERQAIYIIERNPFGQKFDWTRNIISIEIDRPITVAAKTSLVYDSVAKKLYQYMNGKWIPLNMLKIS